MCGGGHIGPWLAGLQKIKKNSDSNKTVTKIISVDSAEDATSRMLATEILITTRWLWLSFK